MKESESRSPNAAERDNTGPLANRMRRLPRYLRALVTALERSGPRADLLSAVSASLGFDALTADKRAFTPLFTVPTEGPWRPRSWIGLADRVGAETPPEETLVALALQHWIETPNNVHTRALHWGADCWFALALQGSKPREHTLSIDAVVSKHVALEGGARRLDRFAQDRFYDLAFLQPAAPTEHPFGPPPSSDRLACFADDLGRMSVIAWRERLFDVLEVTCRQLVPGGTLILLSPIEIRTGGRPHRRARLSYEMPQAQNLLGGVRGRLAAEGLKVATDIAIEPTDSLLRPLYQRRHCFWRLTIARRPRLSLAPQPLETTP